MEPGFVVVLPVKPPASGKSRLVGLSQAERRDLAEAFALDTAAACLAARLVGQVLVATDDARFAAHLAAAGCATIPDGSSTGLNPALVQAAAEARRRWPHLQPVALLADLPALRSDELDAALGSLPDDDPCFVPDADGTGTTLYTAAHDRFAPAFGGDSAEAHRQLGGLAVGERLSTLRRDVDDLDDLRAAHRLGLGPATAEVVARVPALSGH